MDFLMFELYICGIPLALFWILAIILLPMYRREKTDPEFKAKMDRFRDAVGKPFEKIKLSQTTKNILVFLAFCIIMYLLGPFPGPDE